MTHIFFFYRNLGEEIYFIIEPNTHIGLWECARDVRKTQISHSDIYPYYLRFALIFFYYVLFYSLSVLKNADNDPIN